MEKALFLGEAGRFYIKRLGKNFVFKISLPDSQVPDPPDTRTRN